MSARPFPRVTGGCFCGAVRYQLLAPPLFCYACHCSDCQKATGSVFGCFTVIETDYLISTGNTRPHFTPRPRPSGVVRTSASCPQCATVLWAAGDKNPVTADVRTGTLDHPELMEPDLHAYVESRIPWVGLPDGAKTCKGPFNFRTVWPKSSLKRFDEALGRHAQMERVNGAEGGGEANEDEREADKTPTAQSPEEKEDDDEFEKRFRETERALQERLEKLTLKLNEEEKGKTVEVKSLPAGS